MDDIREAQRQKWLQSQASGGVQKRPAAAAAASTPAPSKGFTNQPARIGGISSATSSSSAAGNGNVHGVQHAPQGAEGTEENLLKGDLARMLGIYGRTQQVGKHEIPLVYLLVGGILALLWISGQTNVIKMLVFGFVMYNMYVSYQKAQAAGASPSQAFFGGGGAPGTDSGGDGGSSGGTVINRGAGRK